MKRVRLKVPLYEISADYTKEFAPGLKGTVLKEGAAEITVQFDGAEGADVVTRDEVEFIPERFRARSRARPR